MCSLHDNHKKWTRKDQDQSHEILHDWPNIELEFVMSGHFSTFAMQAPSMISHKLILLFQIHASTASLASSNVFQILLNFSILGIHQLLLAVLNKLIINLCNLWRGGDYYFLIYTLRGRWPLWKLLWMLWPLPRLPVNQLPLWWLMLCNYA